MNIFGKRKEEIKKVAKVGGAAAGFSLGAFVLELVKVALISLAIIIPVRYYLIQPFFVKGESMEPNFADGEYLIVDEISYRFDEPQRGDVVVFKFPKDPSQYYIKRIIGLPGEKVEVDEGRVIVYNDKYPAGIELDESYLPQNRETLGRISMTLDKNEYFVLGDNRGASSDSRVWGILPKDKIIGRVWLRGWPMARASVFSTPLYKSVID